MTLFQPTALDGKVAIVTGASSGLGAHIVEVLAHTGATVIAAARRRERLDALAAQNDRIVGHTCDMSDDEQVIHLVDQTVTDHGRVDIVINNAGVTDGPASALDEPMTTVRWVSDVNLHAPFLLAREAAKNMMHTGEGGSIVNIASIHGFVAAAPNNQAAYVASKAAIIGLTKELAGQWARYDIRVNAIAPGYFPSELTQDMMTSDEAGLGYIKKNTYLRRPGELRELDGPVLLLASDAGTYITGQTITVDGGWTIK